MKTKAIILALFITLITFAQDQKIGEIGDFSLVNGGQIIDCKIGYRIIGKMNEEKSNIIVYPTWFSGKSESLVSLSARLFDTTKYCIIAIDALGNGITSSPSNSELMRKSAFPEFSVKDMVNSQYLLLTKVLGISHISGIIGGSMGGMQVFQWVVSYPGYMDKAIAYVGSPDLTAFDIMLWKAQILAIEQWERDGGSKDDLSDLVCVIHNLLITTPENKNQQVARKDFDKYLTDLQGDFRKRFEPYDWKSQLTAMTRHDISVNGSLQTAAESIKASFLIIVGSQDLIVNPVPAIQFADKYNFKKFVFENNCGHLSPGCEFEKFKEVINNFLDEPLN